NRDSMNSRWPPPSFTFARPRKEFACRCTSETSHTAPDPSSSLRAPPARVGIPFSDQLSVGLGQLLAENGFEGLLIFLAELLVLLDESIPQRLGAAGEGPEPALAVDFLLDFFRGEMAEQRAHAFHRARQQRDLLDHHVFESTGEPSRRAARAFDGKVQQP